MPDFHRQLATTHGQFYLRDSLAYCGDFGADHFWNKPALRRRLAVAPGMMAIGTVQACPREASIHMVVGRRCPPREIAACPHVVQCSIRSQSGKFYLEPCCEVSDETSFALEVAPGWFRACILFEWIEKLPEDYSDVPEHYRIYLWPAPRRPLEFTKGKVWNSRRKSYRNV